MNTKMFKIYTQMQVNKQKTIMGIDLGTTRMGVGVISIQSDATPYVLYSGIVSTITTQDIGVRLEDIYSNLTQLVKKYTPDYIAFEDVYFVKNKKTALDVASARGILFLVATQHNKQIQTYTPLQVKQSVAGWGRADKKQVQSMVQRLLLLQETPKPDDVADALAVAICCNHATPYNELLATNSYT